MPWPGRLHSAAPELLAGAWCAFRETVVAGDVPREHKETVAAVVSEINRCPWCVDAHTTMLRAGAHGSVADELGRGELTRRPDSGFGRIAAWAAATRTPGSPALRSAPSWLQRPAIGSGEDRNRVDAAGVALGRCRQRPAIGSGEDRNGGAFQPWPVDDPQRPAIGSGEDRNGTAEQLRVHRGEAAKKLETAWV